jgi:hypothetical protein
MGRYALFGCKEHPVRRPFACGVTFREQEHVFAHCIERDGSMSDDRSFAANRRLRGNPAGSQTPGARSILDAAPVENRPHPAAPSFEAQCDDRALELSSLVEAPYPVERSELTKNAKGDRSKIGRPASTTSKTLEDAHGGAVPVNRQALGRGHHTAENSMVD